jgi:hypothetical protein
MCGRGHISADLGYSHVDTAASKPDRVIYSDIWIVSNVDRRNLPRRIQDAKRLCVKFAYAVESVVQNDVGHGLTNILDRFGLKMVFL